MMPHKTSIGGALILALLTAVSESRGADPDCGGRCLYFLVALEGRPATLEDIEAALPAQDPLRGHSMKELRDASAAIGLPLAGIRLRGPLERPGIALLRGDGRGHFVVVRPVGHTGTLLQVIDPLTGPSIIEAKLLLTSSEWTGLILVPQRSWIPTKRLLALPVGVLVVLTGSMGLKLIRNRQSKQYRAPATEMG